MPIDEKVQKALDALETSTAPVQQNDDIDKFIQSLGGDEPIQDAPLNTPTIQPKNYGEGLKAINSTIPKNEWNQEDEDKLLQYGAEVEGIKKEHEDYKKVNPLLQDLRFRNRIQQTDKKYLEIQGRLEAAETNLNTHKAEVDARRSKFFNEQITPVIGELETNLSELKKKRDAISNPEAYNSFGMQFVTGSVPNPENLIETINPEVKQINDQIKSVKLATQFAKNIKNLSSVSGDQYVKGLFKGLTHTDWLDIATMNLKSINEKYRITDILKRKEKGLTISDEDEAAVEMYNTFNRFASFKDKPITYEAAQSFAQSLPYMAQFMIGGTVMSGTRAAIVKAVGPIGLDLGKMTLVEIAKKQGIKTALRVAGAESLGTVATQTGTTLLGTAGINNAAQRDLDNYNISTDENGEINVTKATDFENAPERFIKGYFGAFIDNISETTGGALSPKAFGIKLGGGKNSVINSFANTAKKLQKATGIQEGYAEVGEEYVAKLGQTLIFDPRDEEQKQLESQGKDKWDDFFNVREFGTILISTYMTQGIFKAAQLPNFIDITKQRGKVNGVEKTLNPEYKEGLIGAMNLESNEDRVDAIQALGLNDIQDPVERATILDYIKEKTYYDVLKGAKLGESEFNGVLKAKQSVQAITHTDGNVVEVTDQEGIPLIIVSGDYKDKNKLVIVVNPETGERKQVAVANLSVINIRPSIEVERTLVEDALKMIPQQEQQMETEEQVSKGELIEPEIGSSLEVGENIFNVVDYSLGQVTIDIYDKEENLVGSQELSLQEFNALLPQPEVNNTNNTETATNQATNEPVIPESTQNIPVNDSQIPVIPTDKDGNPDYDNMEPIMFAQEFSKEFGVEETVTELNGLKSAITKSIETLTKKNINSTSLNEKVKVKREIAQLNTRLSGIDNALATLSNNNVDNSTVSDVQSNNDQINETDQIPVSTEEGLPTEASPNQVSGQAEEGQVDEEKLKQALKQKPFIDEFLSKKGLTLEQIKDLTVEEQSKLQEEFNKSKEFQDMDSALSDKKEVYFTLKDGRIGKLVSGYRYNDKSEKHELVLEFLNGTQESISTLAEIDLDKQTTKADYENNGKDVQEQTNNLQEGQTPEVSTGGVSSNQGETTEVQEEISVEPVKDLNALLSEADKNIEIRQEEKKVNTDPTEGQKEAGNYQMGHIQVRRGGKLLDISIENPKGSTRNGVDRNGKAWSQVMSNAYGYFGRTNAKDGDHVDVFIGDNPETGLIFIVDQINPDTKKFDEHKVMLGFSTAEKAKAAYLSNYEEGWQGMGQISPIASDKFKKWVFDKTQTKKPFAYKENDQFKKKRTFNYSPETLRVLNKEPESAIESMLQYFAKGGRISTKDFKYYIIPDTKSKEFSSRIWAYANAAPNIDQLDGIPNMNLYGVTGIDLVNLVQMTLLENNGRGDMLNKLRNLNPENEQDHGGMSKEEQDGYAQAAIEAEERERKLYVEAFDEYYSNYTPITDQEYAELFNFGENTSDNGNQEGNQGRDLREIQGADQEVSGADRQDGVGGSEGIGLDSPTEESYQERLSSLTPTQRAEVEYRVQSLDDKIEKGITSVRNAESEYKKEKNNIEKQRVSQGDLFNEAPKADLVGQLFETKKDFSDKNMQNVLTPKKDLLEKQKSDLNELYKQRNKIVNDYIEAAKSQQEIVIPETKEEATNQIQDINGKEYKGKDFSRIIVKVTPDGIGAYLELYDNEGKKYGNRDMWMNAKDLLSNIESGYFTEIKNEQPKEVKQPFSFMTDSPMHQARALGVLTRNTKVDGVIMPIYKWIESLPSGLETGKQKITTRHAKSDDGTVEKLILGNFIVESKAEQDYYNYIQDGGTSYSQFLADKKVQDDIIAEQKKAEKEIKDKEFEEKRKKEDEGYKKAKDAQIKEFIENGQRPTLDKMLKLWNDKINNLKSKPQTAAVKQDIEFNERMIEQTIGQIGSSYDIASTMYEIVNGEVKPKYTFNIGDKVMYPATIDAKPTFIETVIESLRESNDGHTTYKVEKKEGIVNPYSSYDGLKPIQKQDTYGQDNKFINKEKYEELKKKMRDRLNNLNSGVDPEMMVDGIMMAAYHVEAGARKFGDFARIMIQELGEGIKPYLKSFYTSIMTHPNMQEYVKEMDSFDNVVKFDLNNLTDEVETPNLDKNTNDEPRDLQPDSPNGTEPTDQEVVESGRGEQGVQPTIAETSQGDAVNNGENPQGKSSKSIESLLGGVPTSDRAGGNNEVSQGEQGKELQEYPTGDQQPTGGSKPSQKRPKSNPRRNELVGSLFGDKVEAEIEDDPDFISTAAELTPEIQDRKNLQDKADKTHKTNRIADLEDIRESLPMLLPQQQEDVFKAESRFNKELTEQNDTNKGIMFTNGTGTGKTFTGLGIVKRMVKEGKGRILIVTPSQVKNSDWKQDGELLNLKISILESTQDAGKGVVVTTYANMVQNQALLAETFDMVMYDESHKLMENKDGSPSSRTYSHYMLSNKDKGSAYSRLTSIHPVWIEYDKLYNQYKELNKTTNNSVGLDMMEAQYQEHLEKIKKIEIRIDELTEQKKQLSPALEDKAKEASDKTKVVFLSATPFKAHKNLRYVNKYLFNWGEGQVMIGNSRQDHEAQFFVENFGYQIKYHKLTSPPKEVDQALMEIQFTEKLRKEGSLSGRAIDSDYDYGREFPMISGFNSELFNRAYNDMGYQGEFEALSGMRHKVFSDYNYSTQMMEVIKIAQAKERIQKHLDMGRKVVVFHRRINTNVTPPFAMVIARAESRIAALTEDITHLSENGRKELAELTQAVNGFLVKYADLMKYEQTLNYDSVPTQLREAFGDRMVELNGTISKKNRKTNMDDFNRDGSNKDIIVVQEDAGKEGISLHDRSGKHQRVFMSFALPNSTITVLQSEGRIYRIGQKSNAIFEYPLLNINPEYMMFGSNINKRLSTTENMAMGEESRDLLTSFKEGVMSAADNHREPSNEQGIGGKEMDRKMAKPSPWDKAISLYYSNFKRNSKSKSQEGTDYYATPEPIGMKMMEWANLSRGDKMLEPSAGHGAIAMWIPEGVGGTALEPSSELYAKLSIKAGGPDMNLKRQTFEDLDIINKYNAVVMNPPYGSGGKTAMEHLEKAFNHIGQGGRVLCIVPDGPSMDKRLEKFLYDRKINEDGTQGELLNPEAHLIAEIKLPESTFNRAGTSVRTKIVIIDRLKVPKIDIQKEINSENYRRINASRSGRYMGEYEQNEFVKNLTARNQAIQSFTDRPTEKYDFSDAKDVTELFDRIRDIDIRERFNPNKETVSETINPNEKEIGTPTENGVTVIGARYLLQKHTKTGADRHTVILPERLDKDKYYSIAEVAKGFGGKFNSFKGYGTIPGFEFSSKEQAESFLNKISREGANFSTKNPLYSNTERALSLIEQEKATPEQWKAMLLNNGSKQSELTWMGFDDFVQGKKTLSKTDLSNFVNSNKIRYEVIKKGNTKPNPATVDDITTIRLSQYGRGSWIVRFKQGIDGPVEITLDEAPTEDEAKLMAVERVNYDNTEYIINKPKYEAYKTEGGSNYKEVLITIPSNIKLSVKQNASGYWDVITDSGEVINTAQTEEGANNYVKYDSNYQLSKSNKTFQSSHFEEPNIAVHLRTSEFNTKDGKRILHIEEVQSDWAQKGKKEGFKSDNSGLKEERENLRKEYSELQDKASKLKESTGLNVLELLKTNEQFKTDRDRASFVNERLKEIERELINKMSEVPDMPFKQTDQWVGLGMKWAIQYAAENGFDGVSWTKGEQQAARYNLAKHVDELIYENDNSLVAINKDGDNVFGKTVNESELESVIGKEVAQKLIDARKQQNDKLLKQVVDEAVRGGMDISQAEQDATHLLKEPLGTDARSTTDQWERLTNAVGDRLDLNEIFHDNSRKPIVLSNQDLKFGGEGMKAFYDLIIPSWVNKYTKKWGTKTTTAEIDTNPDVIEHGIDTNTGEVGTSKKYLQVHYIPITDQMANSVITGQPMFSTGNEKAREFRHAAAIKQVIDDLNEKIQPEYIPYIASSKEDLIKRMIEDDVNKYDIEDIIAKDLSYDKGFHIPNTNLSYILAFNLISPEEAREVWLHEVGSHAGIEALIPDPRERKKFLNHVWKSIGYEEFKRVCNETGHSFDNYKDDSDDVKAREYLAMIAPKILTDEFLTPKEKGTWDLFMAWANALIEKVLLLAKGSINFTQKELATIVKASFNAIRKETAQDMYSVSERDRNGREDRSGDSESTTIHRRVRVANSGNFRWFLSSSHSDSNPRQARAAYEQIRDRSVSANELVTIHGTNTQFPHYDLSYAGEGTGEKNHGFGIYQTLSIPEGVDYANKVMLGTPKTKALINDVQKQFGDSGKALLVKSMLENETEKSKENILASLNKRLEASKLPSNQELLPKMIDYIQKNEWPDDRIITINTINKTDGSEMNLIDLDNPFNIKEEWDIITKQLQIDGYNKNEFIEAIGLQAKENELPTGMDVYKAVSKVVGGDALATNLLLRAGFDGNVYMSKNGRNAVNLVIFDPRDIKIRETVNFSTKTPDYVGSLFKTKEEQEETINALKATHLSRYDKAREFFQDRMLSLKKLQEEVIKRGGTIKEQNNPYIQENLSSSRSHRAMERFREEQMKPLIASVENVMKETGATLQEVIEYMKAKHTPERNRTMFLKDKIDAVRKSDLSETEKAIKIKDINSTEIPDDARFSGKLNSEDAIKLTEAFEKKASKEAFEDLWAKTNAATEFTLKAWKQYGFMNQDTYKAIKDREWNHYVPLRGWDVDLDAIFDYSETETDGGFSFIAKTKGRESEADTPLAYISAMGYSAIAAGEKNRVKQSAIRLIASNKSMKDLFKIKEVFYVETGKDQHGDPIYDERYERPEQKLWDEGKVKKSINIRHKVAKANSKSIQNEVEAMINGQRIIGVFTDPVVGNAINYKNQFLEHTTRSFQNTIGKPTRWLSSNFTAKNPAFIPINLIRDLGFAMSYHTVDKEGHLGKFLKDLPKARAAINRHIKGKADLSKKEDLLYQNFLEHGGRTGYVHIDNLETIKKDLIRDINTLNQARNKKLRYIISEKIIRNSGKWLEHMAERSENLSRFSTFMASVESGNSYVKAAYDAKNVTVNFNRKGRASGLFGTTFAFFNASVQGGQSIAGLAYRNKGKFIALSAGFYALGILVAAMNDNGDDDEKDYFDISEFIRQNYLTIHISGNKHVSLPLPHGFRAFYAMGEMSYCYATGRLKGSKFAKGTASSLVNSVSPIDAMNFFTDEGGLSMRPIVPTIVVPLYDWKENKDFTGRNIYREPFTKDLADKMANSSQYLKSVNPWMRSFTDFIYEQSGGDLSIRNRYVKKDSKMEPLSPYQDINPSVAENMITYYLGGRGKFFSDLVTTTSNIIGQAHEVTEGKELGQAFMDIDVNSIPVLSRLIREPYTNQYQKPYKQFRLESDAFNFNLKQGIKAKDFDLKVDYKTDIALRLKSKVIEKSDDQLDKLNDLLYGDKSQYMTSDGLQMLFDRADEIRKNAVIRCEEIEKENEKN